MAELGAVASVVQLADVALRMSGEVCKFLDAYKSADRNAKLLSDGLVSRFVRIGDSLMKAALRDVEANVRNLRRYVIQFRKSKAAVDEYENLSETVIRALHGYDTDILAVKRLLPTKPLEKVSEKARWAMKKRETQELLERITQRNLSLTTALGILDSQQSLRIRKDTQEILAKQTASNVVPSRNMAEIDLKMQKQEDDHVELLSQSRNILTGIQSMKASSDRQHKTLTSVATQQAAFTNDRLKRIDRSGLRLARSTEQAKIKLDELGTQVQQSSEQTQQTIDAMITGMKGIQTKATFSASSIDTITKVIREEIRATLKPLVEEVFDQKEAHREEALRRLGSLNDAITREIGSDISTQRTSEASEWHARHTTYSNGCTANQNEDSWRMHCEPNVAQPLTMTQDSSSLYCTVATYKRTWSRGSSFGKLGIQVSHTHHRIDGSPQSRSYTSVEVNFWPSQRFLRLPQISAFYSTAPTPGGYYQLAPTVAVYPVISEDHPVFAVIQSGDLVMLQRMLATGQIHLKSRRTDGQTLLHYAAVYGKIDICTFLSGHGLSWYQGTTDPPHVTPLWYWLSSHLSMQPKLWSLSEPLDVLDNVSHGMDYDFLSLQGLSDHYMHRLAMDGFDDRKFERNFRRRWPNHWDEFRADVFGSWQIGILLNAEPFMSNYLSALHKFLQSGWSPNMASLYKLRLVELPMYQQLKQKLLVPSCFGQLKALLRCTKPREMPYYGFLICIMLLVVGGAEIYYIDPEAFDSMEHWSGLPSYFRFALSQGLFHEWTLVLELSGRDPDHNFLEDERRRKQAFRLHGATRSGVDEAILDPPPIDGLRCRRCRRKYCNNHDLSIFG